MLLLLEGYESCSFKPKGISRDTPLLHELLRLKALNFIAQVSVAISR